MRITFHGGAGEVTGSCYLVESVTDSSRMLRFMVDCGMFQGGRESYRKNLSALGCGVRELDFVILTHAHLDHSGLLPRLTALGYRGPVYATPATADLLQVMLLDSAHIQEKESEWENRHFHGRHARRGWERAPLYTVAQAQSCLRQLQTVEYGVEFVPHGALRCKFQDAGHILGSAILEIVLEAESSRRGGCKKLVFSGDLGQAGRPVLRDPTAIGEADVLLVESTYGNRLHKSLTATEDELVDTITTTLMNKRGNVILPSFSVGRTQEVLFVLTDLVRRGRLPHLDIYVDSPMAVSATELTMKYRHLLDDETQALIDWQQQHPDRPRIRYIRTVEDSMALNQIRSGAVIVSASGMCDAGRIKYHLQHNLSRRECSILITGFQAAGTLGRRLVEGARRVRLFGQELAVRADIYTIGGLSAHADRDGLLGWLGHFSRPPRRCFIVHGEAEIAASFAATVREILHWQDVAVPRYGEAIEIH
ncbi:MAG: MBL fold metallo-hydrolase [Betaproteobacteria bacterium]|nr:MBL fold metallo-hydrolase [Betaproteobacteria bacterium]